jgi:hypothetical protein
MHKYEVTAHYVIIVEFDEDPPSMDHIVKEALDADCFIADYSVRKVDD